MENRFKTVISGIFSKIKWREIFALVMLLLAFVFFHNEKKEIAELVPQIKSAQPLWLIAGLGSTVLYILLQAAMYVYSFRAAGYRISLIEAADIFLKRNLLSVFLPAGGITSLAYLPKNLRKKNIPNTAVHQASTIYGFVGFLTVVIVGIPLIIYAVNINLRFAGNAWILAGLGVVLLLVFMLYISFRRKGFLYIWLKKHFPKAVTENEAIFTGTVNRNYFWITVLISVLIEFCGIFQVLIAMYALGGNAEFSAAALAYIISVILMMVSPFLRGLGAVEFSMAYILTAFGFNHSEGLGITLLYRLFEFWLPLGAGLVSYFWNGRKLAARLIPTALIFILGAINILSVITPPIAERAELNQIYFPVSIIHYSKILTFITGILLLFTAAYMLKGYRRAWYVAVALSLFSIAGNLLKALDYEEAAFAFVVLLLLFYSRNEYRLGTKKFSFIRGFSVFLMLFVAVVIMNFLSFYFIDRRHFGIDFTWTQSIFYTLHTFLFFKDNGLNPQTVFAREFQYLNHILGIVSWVLLIYSFYKAAGINSDGDEADFERAEELTKIYGMSSLDYFKMTDEKNLYFSTKTDGYVSYRNDRNFAVVLDEPVCALEDKISLTQEFEEFCHAKGLRVCYYRVDEETMNRFRTMNRKNLKIGQEGIVQVQNFKMEGKDKKSLRNAMNTLEKKGYKAEVVTAPHSADMLDGLQLVSDTWLKEFDKKEIVFAEGEFNREVLENQDVIVLKNENGDIKAFLNIIPDYAPSECTYDMIRRTPDAPNGSMDLLMLKVIEYARSKNLDYVNLGMAPLAGLENTDSTAEQIMKFAYNRLGNFQHYHSLRFFKEKYADFWQNKYLIYSSDADLLQLPVTLNQIMKPQK